MNGIAPRISPNVTRVAPHVRDTLNLRGVMIRVVLALMPCVALGIYNAGYQECLAMARDALASAPGWRGIVLDSLGVGSDPDSVAHSIWHGLLYFLPAFAVAAVTGMFWQAIFARLRRREINEGVLVTALVFTLILPPGAPLWQIALGMTFGVVVGKEIFGGTGMNFVNPALAGLAFLYLAYPQALAGDGIWTGVSGYSGTAIFSQVAATGMDALARENITWTGSVLGLMQGAFGVTSTLACLIGALVLLATGVASWRVMAGVLAGAVAAAVLFNAVGGEGRPILGMPWYWHLTLGGFAFGMVFLAPEPVTAASTRTGRWIYGLLIGSMIVLIRVANPMHPDGVMLAILLGNILAPLIDYGVVRANIRRRVRRCG